MPETSPRPFVVLDLFSCEGGAAAGYMRAGATVYGVDLEPRFAKRYPGTGFRVADALVVLRTLLTGGKVRFTRRPAPLERHPEPEPVDLGLEDVDFIHASPPCQGYTRGNAGKVTAWPRLIPAVRDLLVETGKPYVIENVEDAARFMLDPVRLCGCMFGLSTPDVDGDVRLHLLRPRMFETNLDLESPRPCDHARLGWIAGAYGGARKAYRLPWESDAEVAPRDRYVAKYVRKGGYVPRNKEVVARLLGVEHGMTWKGLHECIPPAYSEWIGLSARLHSIRTAAA